MSILSTFFKERHTSLGVFYPLHCLVAVFGDAPSAQKVRRNLVNASFDGDEVIAVEGKDFIEFEKEDTGLGGVLMQEVSRFFGTEQVSTDQNIDFAKQQAALVIVHCPSEERKNKAWAVIKPEGPLAAHYYDQLAVDHLLCADSTD